MGSVKAGWASCAQLSAIFMSIQPKDTSKGHFFVSLAKSMLRIGAGICVMNVNHLAVAGTLLVVAEILGIVEELV